MVLGRDPHLDNKGMQDLGPKLEGKARILVEDNAESEAVDVEDSTVEFLKDVLKGGRVLEGDEMCVGGKVVHNDHDRCIAIGFVKGAGEVYG